ncbi:MAG TPA: hypothetical protein VF881_14895 [Polyangiaceae bacterium]
MRRIVAVLFMGGCVGHLTPLQRVQDAAQELNVATRFGRMDLATERVNRKTREQFVRQHSNWGSTVRVVDCEVSGLRLRDPEHAEVTVTVNWQRFDDSELRATHIAQRWQDHRGTWLLESEQRTGGDVGLLGEPTTAVRPPAQQVQFETITIR